MLIPAFVRMKTRQADKTSWGSSLTILRVSTGRPLPPAAVPLFLLAPLQVLLDKGPHVPRLAAQDRGLGVVPQDSQDHAGQEEPPVPADKDAAARMPIVAVAVDQQEV